MADVARPAAARPRDGEPHLAGTFGEGIVTTPNDFGRQGDAPTHPELLDWLAVEFAERGWSIKQMHRLIMLSNTYRASSVADEESLQKDPENHYLSRMNRRRLDGDRFATPCSPSPAR